MSSPKVDDLMNDVGSDWTLESPRRINVGGGMVICLEYRDNGNEPPYNLHQAIRLDNAIIPAILEWSKAHTLHIPTFAFADLDDKAKAKARQKFVEAEAEYGETLPVDWFTEDCQHTLENVYGLTGGEADLLAMEWSLGSCQGDGVAFSGVLDANVLCRTRPEVAQVVAQAGKVAREHGYDYLDVDIEITNPGHYSHWNSMLVEAQIGAFADEDGFDFDDVEREIEEETLSLIQAASRELEATGYAAIEYNQSDEHVDECLGNNDQRFTVDGAGVVALD